MNTDNTVDRSFYNQLLGKNGELRAALVQAIEESGFNVCGPTNWLAAENNEPHWVCKARLIL